MSVTEAKAIYETLKEQGDLEVMIPDPTGEWVVDKKMFLKIYNSNQEMLNDSLNEEYNEDN